MKLNTMKKTASAIPAVESIMKITVRETCTGCSCSRGFPSNGMPPNIHIRERERETERKRDNHLVI